MPKLILELECDDYGWLDILHHRLLRNIDEYEVTLGIKGLELIQVGHLIEGIIEEGD